MEKIDKKAFLCLNQHGLENYKSQMHQEDIIRLGSSIKERAKLIIVKNDTFILRRKLYLWSLSGPFQARLKPIPIQ